MIDEYSELIEISLDPLLLKIKSYLITELNKLLKFLQSIN